MNPPRLYILPTTVHTEHTWRFGQTPKQNYSRVCRWFHSGGSHDQKEWHRITQPTERRQDCQRTVTKSTASSSTSAWLLEMVVDFKKTCTTHSPVWNWWVASNSQGHPSLSQSRSCFYKKVHQDLYIFWRMSSAVLYSFYRCTVESILRYCIIQPLKHRR